MSPLGVGGAKSVGVNIALNGQDFIRGASTQQFHFLHTPRPAPIPFSNVVGTKQTLLTFYGLAADILLEEPIVQTGAIHEELVFQKTPMFYGFYSFYALGAVSGKQAEICATSLVPSLGPSTGGSTVNVTIQGTVPTGQADFFCRFGKTGTRVTATNVEYVTTTDTIRFSCNSTAGAALGSVPVSVGLNGDDFSSSGAMFAYHAPLTPALLEPASVPSEGGTSLKVYLTAGSAILPTGVATSELIPSCNFTKSGVSIETQGTYFAPESHATLGTAARVECIVPGFLATKLKDTASVSVSLIGQQYGESESLTLTAGASFYGQVIGLEPMSSGDTIGTPVTTLITKSTDVCLMYNATRLATLQTLVVSQVYTNPDLSTTTTQLGVSPGFVANSEHRLYKVKVPYAAASVAIDATAMFSYSNIFVQSAIHRRFTNSIASVPNFGTKRSDVSVHVVAADGSNAEEYVVEVQRALPSTSTTLTALKITEATYDIIGVNATDDTITPAFSDATLSYTASVHYAGGASLTFEPTFANAFATAKVYLDGDETNAVNVGAE